MKVKPYAEQGHYTNVHDALFDIVMPSLSGNTWKVLCYILRRTRGWRVEQAGIAYRDIIKGTGIKHSMTVRRALKQLAEGGHIIPNRSDEKWEATTYRLNRNLELELSTSNYDVDDALAASRNDVDNFPSASKNDVGAESINDANPTSKSDAFLITNSDNQDNQHAASQHAKNKNSSSDQNSQENHSDGWQLMYRAVMEACGITDARLQADGKLKKDVADVVRALMKDNSDRTPCQIAKRIRAFGMWWSYKENKGGQRYGLPTPPTILRFWGQFVQWCKDNLEGFLPTEETFTVAGIKA